MKTFVETPGLPFQTFAAVMLASLLVGCATTPKIDWSSRVGSYTYDQAVLEFGPPEKNAKLADGTVIAEWLTRHGYTRVYTGFAYGYPGYPYYWPPYPSYDDIYMPDYFLRLTFGPDGKLKAWKKFAR